MKKLMIAAAIVCAAVVSQAASIAWELSDASKTSEAGYTVYIVSALSQFTGVQDILAAAVPHTDGAVSSTVTKGARGGESAKGSTVNSAWESVDSVDFYYVIVKDDISGYWTSEKQTALVAKGTGTPTSSKLTTLGTIAAGQMTAFGVPEPTSGLLFLLGVAGLALRRRRA